MLNIPLSTIRDWILYGKIPGRRPSRRYSLYDYYQAMRLFSEGSRPHEISTILAIPVSTIKSWIYDGKKPMMLYDKLKIVGNFSRYIERFLPVYHNLVCDRSKWHIISYLYGVRLSDGTLYETKDYKYAMRVTGEYIFLERVNEAIYLLIGKRYSIRKDRNKDRYIMDITNKAFYQLMGNSILWMTQIIEYSQDAMRFFILGLTDGDGKYDPSKNLVILRKAKWKPVAYSWRVLTKLGVKWSVVRTKEKGTYHIYKGKPIFHKRDRLGWSINAEEFVTKIGPTIKILKKNLIHPKVANKLHLLSKLIFDSQLKLNR